MIFEKPDRKKRDFVYRVNLGRNFAHGLSVRSIKMIIFVLELKDAEHNIFKVGGVDAGKPICETCDLSQSI
jgi:hypothetical protein